MHSMPDIFSAGYGMIPKRLMQSKGLNISEKAILAYFLSFTGAGKNTCWPSVRQIMGDLGISSATATKHISALAKKGWIIKREKYPDDPWKHRSEYVLNFFTTDVSESKTCDVLKNETSHVLESKTSSINKNSNNNNNKTIPFDSKFLFLATLLKELHQQEDGKYTTSESNVMKWANDIRLLSEKDGRSVQEIEAIIRWAKTQGNFWFPNIMSGKKLREKFPTLLLQAKRDSKFRVPEPEPEPVELTELEKIKDQAADAMGGRLMIRDVCKLMEITSDEMAKKADSIEFWEEVKRRASA